MDEDAKREAEYPILNAFNSWGQRFNELLRKEYANAPAEEQKELTEKTKDLDLFLSKRAFVPGFSVYVMKQISLNRSLMRQQAMLTKSCLNSLLCKAPLNLRLLIDVDNEPLKSYHAKDGPERKHYTRRNVQRLIYDYYPEVFIPLKTKSKEDERLAQFNTIFDRSAPIDVISDDIVSLEGRVNDPDNLKRIIMSNWFIWAVRLEYVIGLNNFKKLCEDYIRSMPKEDARSVYLADKLSTYSGLLMTFYNQINSVVAAQWFMQRRRSVQKRLIHRGFSLKYSRLEAEKVCEYLLDLSGDKAEVFNRFIEAGVGFFYLGFFENAIGACLQSIDFSDTPLDTAIANDNLSICYREMGKHKLMLSRLKKARLRYIEAGEQYHALIAMKNIAEADWALGFKNKADALFAKVETAAMTNQDMEQRLKMLWNLSCAMKRIHKTDKERKLLLECLKIITEEDRLKLFYRIDSRLDELDSYR